MRDSANAVAEYDRGSKKDPKHEEAAVYKAQVLIEEGKKKEGLQTLKQFVQRNPESVLGQYYLGRAYQQDNQFKEAVLAYRKAIELKPSFSQAALTLGYMYEEKGLNAEALSIYKPLYEDLPGSYGRQSNRDDLLEGREVRVGCPYTSKLSSAGPG